MNFDSESIVRPDNNLVALQARYGDILKLFVAEGYDYEDADQLARQTISQELGYDPFAINDDAGTEIFSE